MTKDQLKASILEMAISGKLVPQLDSEQEVTQIGEIPKDVHFEIPSKWKMIKLKYFFKIINGDRGKNYPAKTELSVIPTDNPFVSAANIKNNQVDKSDLLYLSDEQYNKLRSGFIKKNDILLCIRGSLGKFALVRSNGGAIASSLCILREIEKIDMKYFTYIFSSSILFNFIKENKNGTAQPNLGANKLENLFIPIPPLEEQKRIVSKLEQLLPLIEEYGIAYEELQSLNNSIADEIKASILQEAISGKLVPQLDSEQEVTQLGETPKDVPFEIPSKWKWVYLDVIGKWKSGSTPDRDNINYYTNGTIPWIKTGELKDCIIKKSEEYITEEAVKYKALKIQPKNAVLIAMYGATIGKLGILDIEATTNQACCSCTTNKNIYYKYLYYYLMASRKRLVSLGTGGAQPNISKQKIINFPIAIPPLEEQKRIVAKIEQLFEQIQKLA